MKTTKTTDQKIDNLTHAVGDLTKTVDELALATARGFEGVDKQFKTVNTNLRNIEGRLDGAEEQSKIITDQLDRIEFSVNGHERRIENLEDRMIQVARKIGLKFG